MASFCYTLNNILRIRINDEFEYFYIIYNHFKICMSVYICEKIFIRDDILEDEYIKKHTYKYCKVYELKPIIVEYHNQTKIYFEDIEEYDYTFLDIDPNTTYVAE
jgi:hypothetical protein